MTLLTANVIRWNVDPRLLKYDGRRRRDSGRHRTPADHGNLAQEALDVGIDQVGNGNALDDPIGIGPHLPADDVGREDGHHALVARPARGHYRLADAGHAGVDRRGHAKLRAKEQIVGQE